MRRCYPQQEFTDAGKLIARLTHGLAQIKDLEHGRNHALRW
jgi:hypothetical protein